MMARRAFFGMATLALLVVAAFTGGNPAVSSPASVVGDDSSAATDPGGPDAATFAVAGNGAATAVPTMATAIPRAAGAPASSGAAGEPSAIDQSVNPGPGRSKNWRVSRIGLPMYSDDPADAGRKVVMLTFDDGPHPEHTDKILQTLRQHRVMAMFFVTGYGIRNKDVLQRVAAAGHVIGTHTEWHKNLRLMSRDQQRAVIVPVNEAVERLTGQRVRFFRPPFGAYNDHTLSLMQELDLELLNWSHGSGDWIGVDEHGHKEPAEIVADVLASEPRQPGGTTLHPGAVILLHDVHRHTAEALPAIIRGIRAQGYDFVVMDR